MGRYHTKILVLGYINGPEDGLFMLVVAYGCSYFFGPSFWTMDLNTVFHTDFLPDMAINQLVLISSFFPNFITWIFSFVSVFKKYNNRLPYEALQHLITLFIFIACTFFRYVGDQFLWKQFFALHMLAIGLNFSEMTGLLIVSHLTSQKFPLLSRPLWIHLGTTLISFIFGFFDFGIIVLILHCTLSVFSYCSFVFNIIREMTTILNIKCFTISKKYKTIHIL